MLLIDSSAVVRFFSQEDGWERIEKHISEAMTLTLAVSELGSALLKKTRRLQMDLDQAGEILEKYAKSVLLLHDEEYAKIALETAKASGLSICDSMFLAACLDEGLELMTCDGNQAKAARQLGISVVEC